MTMKLVTACLANPASTYEYAVPSTSYMDQVSKIRVSMVKWEASKGTELSTGTYNVFEAEEPFETMNNYSGKGATELLYVV